MNKRYEYDRKEFKRVYKQAYNRAILRFYLALFLIVGTVLFFLYALGIFSLP